MDKKTHYFYALKLPAEIKRYLHQSCLELREVLSFSRWVHHEDIHITLAFLGSANDDQLHNSIVLVEKALRSHEPFPLEINHLGVFGKFDSPRIFWAGTKEEKQLSLVREKVFHACKEAGFQLETRAFHPHITLARKWKGTAPFKIELLEANNPFIHTPQSFLASEVVLYETHLDKVPKYEVKESFYLSS